MSPNPKHSAELLAASPLAVDTADVATATVTFSEPGEIDLNRLLLLLAQDGTAVGNSTEILTHVARITSLELNGSEILVRGRNTPAAPASIFSPNRKGNFINLGTRRVSSGDTLACTVDAAAYAGTVDFTATLGVPFFPDRFRGRSFPALPAGAEVIMASPVTAITAKSATALTITVDHPGYIDLARLTVQMSCVPTSNLNSNDGSMVDRWANLAQMVVRSDYNMVVGQGTPVCPLPNSVHRLRNWWNPGVAKVVAGDTITVTVREESATAAFGSAAVPLIPHEQRGGGCY